MGTQLREHVRGSRADATTTAAAAAASADAADAADAAANGPAAATAAARRTSDAAANGWWNATGNATRHATRNAISDSPNASDAARSYGPDRPGVPPRSMRSLSFVFQVCQASCTSCGALL